MSNTILTPTVVAKEALRLLTNNLIFISKINRSWEGEFDTQVNGYEKGSAVTIRKPARFTSTTSVPLAVQDFNETSTSLTINTQRHVDVKFSSNELTLSLSQFSERVLQPAMLQIANDIDTDALQMYKDVNNIVGTPGTTPNSFLALGNAFARLGQEAAPTTMLSTLLDPIASIYMADALKGLFSPEVVNEAIESGSINTILSDVKMAQGIRQHTVGALGGTPLLNGVPTSGATTLVTNGWTATTGAVKKGDVFTIAGVNAVNPLTRQTTGTLRNFVVTADTTADGSGNMTIPIYPAITSSGALQTVAALPAATAAITILTGTAATAYPQNLMFHRDAFAFASVPLIMPKGVDFSAMERFKGITLRIVRQYDINNDQLPCRIDVLYGYKTVFPELACRITG